MGEEEKKGERKVWNGTEERRGEDESEGKSEER